MDFYGSIWGGGGRLQLDQAEALGALDGLEQVEAGVCHWQEIHVGRLLYAYLHTCHSCNRNPVAACEEGEKLFLILLLKFVENFPEEDYSGVGGIVSLFVGAFLFHYFPVIVFIANHQSHQLLWVEKLQDPLAHHLQKAFLECIKL